VIDVGFTRFSVETDCGTGNFRKKERHDSR